MVCQRWCVKDDVVSDRVVCVTKLCVKDGGRRREEGGEEEDRDTESKTRTPHKDVGNKKPLL